MMIAITPSLNVSMRLLVMGGADSSTARLTYHPKRARFSPAKSSMDVTWNAYCSIAFGEEQPNETRLLSEIDFLSG